jgi:hypothetical protein
MHGLGETFVPFQLTAMIRHDTAVSERRGTAREALALLRRWVASGYATTRISHHGNELSEAELISLVEGSGRAWTAEDHEREADMNEFARPRF